MMEWAGEQAGALSKWNQAAAAIFGLLIQGLKMQRHGRTTTSIINEARIVDICWLCRFWAGMEMRAARDIGRLVRTPQAEFDLKMSELVVAIMLDAHDGTIE